MIDLLDVLYENKLEAIEKLKSYGDELEFTYNKSERPWVLIDNGDGVINDVPVSKIKLVDSNFMLYIEKLDKWIDEYDCLSTTINNVYESVDFVKK